MKTFRLKNKNHDKLSSSDVFFSAVIAKGNKYINYNYIKNVI